LGIENLNRIFNPKRIAVVGASDREGSIGAKIFNNLRKAGYKGEVFPVSRNKHDYRPGHLVTWMLPGNLPHIGIVTDRFSRRTGNPLIVHNIGQGPQLEDMLFDYPITGHYRYVPRQYTAPVGATGAVR